MGIKDMARFVSDKVKIKAQMVEPAATVAFAGIADDRASKIIAGTGIVVMYTGAVVSSKVVALAGLSCFAYGMVRGFRHAMVEASNG